MVLIIMCQFQKLASYGYGTELVLTDYTTTIGSPTNVRSFIDKYGNTHLGFLFNANITEDTRDRTVYASTGKRTITEMVIFIYLQI
jgi:hypothetical protein